MKVIVVFEFKNITDPDSPEATEAIQSITEDCEALRLAFDASACWIDDAQEVQA